MNRIEVEDRNQDTGDFVQDELTDQKMQHEILQEFVGVLVDWESMEMCMM